MGMNETTFSIASISYCAYYCPNLIVATLNNQIVMKLYLTCLLQLNGPAAVAAVQPSRLAVAQLAAGS